MKIIDKTFTTIFIKNNCGCYKNTKGKLKQVYQDNNKTCFEEAECSVSVSDILNSNIPLKDKYWFFCNNMFTIKQNQLIAINCAEIVLPIYEKNYPNDKKIADCIKITKGYLNGNNTKEELLSARSAANVNANAAYTDALRVSNVDVAAYVYVAYAAATVAIYAARAANYAAHATNYAADATNYAADATNYDVVVYAAAACYTIDVDANKQLLEMLMEFCKNNDVE